MQNGFSDGQFTLAWSGRDSKGKYCRLLTNKNWKQYQPFIGKNYLLVDKIIFECTVEMLWHHGEILTLL